MTIQILDTTLRDGSCAIDFNFEEEDVRTIVRGLTANGVEFIEVGHGVSTGLSYPPFQAPRVSDERTFELARAHAGTAKLGAVVVPALTSLRAIEAALERLDFIRLAPAPSLLEGCHEYVEAARRREKAVFLQLVKSHVYQPHAIAEVVRPFVERGVSAVYVVDSAGCMLPDEVSRHVGELKKAFDIPVGFHGHDNLSLALANSLAASKAGATFVDGTLGGIGRGAGNTQLETLVALLQSREGSCRDANTRGLFELSQELFSRFPDAARGIEPVEAFYAVHAWDSLSKRSAVDAARELSVSPFAFIETLVAGAAGPWITDDDVQRTVRSFRSTAGRSDGKTE